jgi:hypothetical protein
MLMHAASADTGYEKINALENPYVPTPREMLPDCWTWEHVVRRLIDAHKTLAKLPRPRGPREPGNNWLEYQHTEADINGRLHGISETERLAIYAERNDAMSRQPPTSREIAEMETAFAWLEWLSKIDNRLSRILDLWALTKAQDRSIRALCKAKGWSRTTVQRKMEKGAVVVAERLNGQRAAVF